MTDPSAPATTENGYRYAPLPGPRAIRLIMLQAGDDDAPLCCEIVETDLDDPRDYSALSYTWGGESPSLPMTVLPAGGNSEPRVMLLTPNCAAALRILRRRIGGARTGLWVDAVCINQGHNGEKNVQVGMMAEIYRRAGVVYVWLGEEFAPRNTRTIKVLSRGLLRWFRELKPKGHVLRHRLVSPFWERAKQWPCRAAVRACGRDGRAPLAACQAPYWSRVWTLQEAAHAGAVLLCCDSEVLELQAAFDSMWVYSVGRPVPVVAFMMHQLLYEGARSQAGFGRFELRSFGQWEVARVTAKGASDPRDRIFALRSAYPYLFGRVEVDYGRDVGEVFAEVTRYLVEQDAEILLEAGGPDNARGMPSWAVDWASERLYYSFWTNRLPATAFGGSAARYRFSDDGRRLYLTGAVVGRVHGWYVSEVLPNFSSQIETLTESEGTRIIDSIIDGVSSWVYGVSAAAAAAAAADDDDDDAETPNETELAVAEADGIPASVIRLISHLAMNDSYASRKARALLQSRLKNKDATRDIRWIVSDDVVRSLPASYYEGSRLFLTTEGRFGWGHAGLLPGDLICAVAGMLWPMAMRPKGSSYVIVGPAVLDGVMNGERWPANEGDLEEWEIV